MDTPNILLIIWIIISVICLGFSIVSFTMTIIDRKELDKVKNFVGYNQPTTTTPPLRR